jgi:uncharacterized cofD-like protein
LHVKRWLLLLVAGLIFVSLGVSFVYVQLYRAVQVPQPVSPLIYNLTLQFIPHWWRGVILGIVGLVILGIALFQLNNSLLSAVYPRQGDSLIDLLCRARLQERGPRVVAVGGGTGLSSLLAGMKTKTDRLGAVVTMADDGGSSGRLRQELGIPPPGDLRHCITALADDESLLTQLFGYRFGGGVGLNGHSFGNLFIAAMCEITGSFEQAVAESSRVLAVQGKILPSTLTDVTLSAELAALADGTPHIRGESAIPEAGAPIERVYLHPEAAAGYSEAIRALLEAEIIIIGPGSLYTSIMPNLLVKDICQAIRASSACKIYVCNVATQPGETDNYDIGAHIQAIEAHVGPALVDYVIGNNDLSRPLPATAASQLVQPTCDASYADKIVLESVVSRENIWRHDPDKLADCIMGIYQEHTRK